MVPAYVMHLAGVTTSTVGDSRGVLKIPWLYRTYQFDFSSKSPAETK